MLQKRAGCNRLLAKQEV